MTFFDYAEAQADADELITEFGSGLQGAIRRSSRSGDAWNPVIEETDHAVTLVESSFEASEIDGTLIRATDKKVLISAVGGVEPAESDRLVIGGEWATVDGHEVLSGDVFQIIKVKPLKPGPTVVYWQVQARA